MVSATAVDHARLDDPSLVRLAQAGDLAAFRAIMTHCNQRLFRIARSVLADDDEAEDVLQEAYLRAFAGIKDFRGEASLFTWLVTITLNEARGRLRRRHTMVDLALVDEKTNIVAFPSGGFPSGGPAEDPEVHAARSEIRRLLESAIDELSPDFRLVFILREVEGYSVDMTAAQLGIMPATVKTRHFRARKQLRKALDSRLRTVLQDTFPFFGERCTKLTERVMAELNAPKP